MNKKSVSCMIAALILVGGCIFHVIGNERSSKKNVEKQLFAMDTVMSFSADGERAEEAVQAAMKEVQRLDALLSTGDEESEIFHLNQEGKGVVSEDTSLLLHEAMEIYQETEGLFDITIYPAMELWGFTNGQYHVPSTGEMEKVLEKIDASKIQTKERKKDKTMEVFLGPGQMIDLGGIGKGFTSDRIMKIYQSYGIISGKVSLGGNVQVLGRKQNGEDWKIGIRDPRGEAEDLLGVISVADQAVVTSGGYERYFEENGKKYIHILDPRTAMPVEGDLISVTIISKSGVVADALSTAVYLMGLEKAETYWQNRKEEFQMILVSQDGKVYATEGVKQNLKTKEQIEWIGK